MDRKKFFFSVISIVLIIAILLAVFVPSFTTLPAIISYIGWLVFSLSELFNKQTLPFRIYFKGILSRSTFRVTAKIADISSVSSFHNAIKEKLERNNFEIISCPKISGTKYKIELKNAKKIPFNLELTEVRSSMDVTDCMIEFGLINSSHIQTKKYCSVIDEILKVIINTNGFHKELEDVNITLNIMYEIDHNPILSEIIKGKDYINISATAKGVKITKTDIQIDTQLSSFNSKVSEILSGNLS